MTVNKPSSRRTRILCALAGLSLGIAGTIAYQQIFMEGRASDSPSASTADIANKPADSQEHSDSNRSQDVSAQTDGSTTARYSSSPSSNQAGTTIYMSAGPESGATVAGHLVDTSRRAVDYPFDGVPLSDPQAVPEQPLPPQEIGRNGLISNPSVDPASTHGAAYSRAWQ